MVGDGVSSSCLKSRKPVNEFVRDLNKNGCRHHLPSITLDLLPVGERCHVVCLKVRLHAVIYRVRFVFWRMKITADATISLRFVYSEI